MKKRRKRCKWCQPNYNNHHRLPKSRGGSSNEANLSVVPTRIHDAYNLLFGSNPTAHEVASILSEHWIDPAYRLLVVPAEDYPQAEEA